MLGVRRKLSYRWFCERDSCRPRFTAASSSYDGASILNRASELRHVFGHYFRRRPARTPVPRVQCNGARVSTRELWPSVMVLSSRFLSRGVRPQRLDHVGSVIKHLCVCAADVVTGIRRASVYSHAQPFCPIARKGRTSGCRRR